jgi:hypothetical protein
MEYTRGEAERAPQVQGGAAGGGARGSGTGRAARAFVPPRLTRHEPLTRITLVSGNDFPGSGGAGGTFFGG